MSAGLQAVREALAGHEAWLVGGAVRDELLGRETADYDVVLAGDPAPAARAIARAAGNAACFALSEEFGGWRVVARDGSWQVDLESLRGESLQADLSLRDFTVNAIARPISGGPAVDPLGGTADLRAGRLRMAGPASFELDPLRVLRLVRVAVELGLEPDEQALRGASEQAARLTGVSGERVFLELRRIVAASEARGGIELMRRLGALAVVLPELEALRGVEQSAFHHADVYEHTLEVLDRAVELTDPAGPRGEGVPIALGRHRDEVARLLAEPLADQVSRGETLRWGALLHDAAKPATRELRPDGRVTFMGHDREGAELARTVLTRLRASERLRAQVAALVRHHLRLGFLVHEPQPLSRRTLYDYLRSTSPVEVEVTVLSVADRLATRGERAEQAIEAHLRLAGAVLEKALEWRAAGPPQPPVRGDELARELGIAEGPLLGELLEDLRAAIFSGEVASRDEAIRHARGMLEREPERPADLRGRRGA